MSNNNLVVTFHHPQDPTAKSRGGKGAGLADLVKLGVPVPPGFTLTTSAWRAYDQHHKLPKRTDGQLRRDISQLEAATGKHFGDSTNPLLVSVRSGAEISMPGMMDTVLNLGLNPSIVQGLARLHGKRFAYDTYRRFLALFGAVVIGVPKDGFEEILRDAKVSRGIEHDSQLDADALEKLCREYRMLIEDLNGEPMVDDPWEQLNLSILAVLDSWNSERATAYRQSQGISSHLGTAVTVQSMVFGNLDDRSATGVVFSHNCATGAPGMWGEFLENAQGEDVVAGIRTPKPVRELQLLDAELYDQLDTIVTLLERSRNAVVDVEFTIESGKLFILQVRNAKLTLEAAMTVAVRSVWDKRISKEDAVSAVGSERINAAKEAKGFDAGALAAASFLGTGTGAAPGPAVGRIVTSSREAVEAADRGEDVILVRPDTSPDDLPGMLAAKGIITMIGGNTSHAAVVARGLNKPAIVGFDSEHWSKLQSGLIISLDGASGKVFTGELPLSSLTNMKEVNLLLKWATTAHWAAPRLAFEYVEQSLSVNQAVADFYLVEALATYADRTKLAHKANELRKQVHTAIAERLSMYLTIAVGGEVRYAKQNWESTKKETAALTKFHIQYDQSDRFDAQRPVIAALMASSHAEHIRFMELTTKVFEQGEWMRFTSVGGTAWAKIARAGLGFLSGQLSHSVFADHAFDLEHNNGSVFGKNTMFIGDRYEVKKQLERKKHATSLQSLYKALTSARLQTIMPSPKVEALYHEVISELG